MPNNATTWPNSLCYAKDVDPTALHELGEYSSHTCDPHDDIQIKKGNAIGTGRSIMNRRPYASQIEGSHGKERSHLLHEFEEAKKATRRVDHDGGRSMSTAYHPCDYMQWDADTLPINISSSAYKATLRTVKKNFPAWQHEVALSGEILLKKINTKEKRHALIEVAKDFGFNSSNPRATTCSFVYVKYTNQVFMRATGEKIPYLDHELVCSMQHLEEQHQAYLELKYKQEEKGGNIENEPQGGGPKCASSGAKFSEGDNKEHVANVNSGRIKQQQPAFIEKGPNYKKASSVPQPYILRWWFVDRYVHRDVLEILRLLACEIGVFRGEPTLSFEQLQRYDPDAARKLENPMIFRVEVALEYQPRWEVELATLLKEEPGSTRDPYPISYVRRDNFAMRQYQRHLRPFFYDWRPVITRCLVDLFQGRDFRANMTPSNVTTMGTAFFLRHEIDTKGQVFYRRWVRHSLDLFGYFGTSLRRQDARNVRETLIRLYREHYNHTGGVNHANGWANHEAMLELLKQAKNSTPHFGALNLCIEFHFFKKDLSELQKFSARYGYFLYIRRDEGMVYVAATARDLPVLPPQRFELFFLPNGVYVGPPSFQTCVDMHLGVTEGAPTPVPPSLISLLEEEMQLTNKRQQRPNARRGGTRSHHPSSSSDSEGKEGRRRRRANRRGGSRSSSASSASASCTSSASSRRGRRRRRRLSPSSSYSSSSSSRGQSPPRGSPNGTERPPDAAAQPPSPRAPQRLYAWPRSLPASSLYDVMVGAGQRLSHPPGCTIESHLVSWEGGHTSSPPRVLHFALNHLTREAHIIGG
ncbi:unnamed protein product [Phytomonas sp. Hart1]|nr:unnamed protein product [Phytomonas sp. Hart1]|eukprot:CCW69137.1 unnamed protein product [Phytomonas sp. isolate Hart1]